MTIGELVRNLEAQGFTLREKDRNHIAVKPSGRVTPALTEVLNAMGREILTYLRERKGRPDIGAGWSRVSLRQLDRIIDVEMPWGEVRLVIAPGCRVARELRATDPQPGRVWCSCEVLKLLLAGVQPEEARQIAEARLTFDATFAGIRRGPLPQRQVCLHGERGGRS